MKYIGGKEVGFHGLSKEIETLDFSILQPREGRPKTVLKDLSLVMVIGVQEILRWQRLFWNILVLYFNPGTKS